MVKKQAEQGNQLATPEELAVRAAVTERKRLQRRREAAAKDLYQRSQDRQQFWADNRSKLKPEQIADLETRQAEFLALAYQVDLVTKDLCQGSPIGPPDGLPFADVLFQEVREY